ncbi:MAG: thiol:disulfide interchange protein DsbA/DsbL [Luteimonas sp.]
MKSLLLGFFLLLPLAASAADNRAVEGRDYELIDNGAPYRPLAGKIEVVEVFAYWCPHCADFDPLLKAWARKLPADVRFDYVPAAIDPNDAFARGYFAAERAGAVERTHDAMFRALHHDGLLANNATIDEIAWFYGQHGLDRAKVKIAMTSPQVDALMQRARAFEVAIQLPGTPTMVVNGRYRITPRTHQDALRIADQLIAQLRAAR